MKLDRPFYKLPVRFDVQRLRAEVEQFADSDWVRHPSDFNGNRALRLLSVNGEETDHFGAPIYPTRQLDKMPYVRQILSEFNVVWSRSRLMWLAPGAEVPAHSDINYHWFNRVRLHIPIHTSSNVIFTCDQSEVHMAAGEAWIFDNWRSHKVVNGGQFPRVHLVADTVGSASFWHLVSRAQSQNFDQPQSLEVPVIPYVPDQMRQLMMEKTPLDVVMHPGEVSRLLDDLKQDIPDSQNDRSLASLREFMEHLIHDWRALWTLFGDSPEGWPHFESLQAQAIEAVKNLNVVARCRSNGALVVEVIYARVLHYLVNRPQSSLQGQRSSKNSGQSNGSVQDINAPVDEPEILARARHAARFRQPIFIVAAPRSGSTMLFEALSNVCDLYTFGGEAHAWVERHPTLLPWNSGTRSNRLTAEHVTPTICAEIISDLLDGLRSRNNDLLAANPAQDRVSVPCRWLEKTPKNSLRIPFFNALFPDALFIHLWRDPRENISSIMDAWRSGGWVTYPELPGWQGSWSMLLPPGWESMIGRTLEEIAAFQWATTNQTILDDLSAMAPERSMRLSYQSLLSNPRDAVKDICEFAGIEIDVGTAGYLDRGLPLSRHTLTPPMPGKWRRNAEEIERVLPSVARVLAQLEEN